MNVRQCFECMSAFVICSMGSLPCRGVLCWPTTMKSGQNSCLNAKKGSSAKGRNAERELEYPTLEYVLNV